ncbi:hypothetical protein Tco_1241620, partial [Tanacetum coccineum]
VSLTIPSVVSTLPHTSPFLYTNSSDNDTSERPPSHNPYKAIVAQWRSRVAACSSSSSSPTHDSTPTDVTPPTMRLLIPFGRPYRTQPNGLRKMLTARKRVRALPLGRLASRYPPNHSSSDHFSSDDSSSDSSSDSSLDYSSDSSSGHSLPDSSVDTPVTISTGPSCKRCRSPAVLVSLATPVPGALSPVYADLLPPRKRIRDAITAFDFDDSKKESYEAYTKPDIDSDVQADIDVDTAAIEAATAREIGVDKVTEPVVLDDVYESTSDDMTESADERELDALVQELHDHLVKIPVWIRVLERDNIRLRGMLCVESERVDSLQCHMSYTQEKLRQIRVMMPTATRTGMTLVTIEEMIERHDNWDGNESGNGGGGGNGNVNRLGGGNRNGNPNVNAGGIVTVARKYTYQDFVKCQPLNFKGTGGVVGPSRWIEKMETVFHISNCPQKYKVKYSTCTLQKGALTFCNSHKRTVRTDASYTMMWKALMKLMTEVYCLRNEIQQNGGWVVKPNPYETPGCCPYCQQLDGPKVEGYAARNVENKRIFDNNSRDNHVQQPPF